MKEKTTNKAGYDTYKFVKENSQKIKIREGDGVVKKRKRGVYWRLTDGCSMYYLNLLSNEHDLQQYEYLPQEVIGLCGSNCHTHLFSLLSSFFSLVVWFLTPIYAQSHSIHWERLKIVHLSKKKKRTTKLELQLLAPSSTFVFYFFFHYFFIHLQMNTYIYS